MKVKKTCIFWWAICAVYIAVTYATLGVMPAMWESFNAFFGGKGVPVQYTLYAMAGLLDADGSCALCPASTDAL